MAVKFGVFADLHVDMFPEPEKRLQVFLDACREADVDFIIELGDFCYPDDDRYCICKPEKLPVNVANALREQAPVNKDLVNRLFSEFEKPGYHVLGNHDSDMCSKEEKLRYHGVSHGPYYSFDKGGFHFVVLDANYYMQDGKYISYNRGNYFDVSYDNPKPLPYLPPEELAWLREDLAKTAYPSVLFSHQRLIAGEPQSIRNAEELREVIRSAPHGVVMALNGHEHLDCMAESEGTWYFGVNSMSNCWLGTMFACPGRCGEEMDRLFPDIQYTVPYTEALYAIVTMDENGADIRGTKAEFVGPSPEELGCYTRSDSKFLTMLVHGPITAEIRDRYVKFRQ